MKKINLFFALIINIGYAQFQALKIKENLDYVCKEYPLGSSILAMDCIKNPSSLEGSIYGDDLGHGYQGLLTLFNTTKERDYLYKFLNEICYFNLNKRRNNYAIQSCYFNNRINQNDTGKATYHETIYKNAIGIGVNFGMGFYSLVFERKAFSKYHFGFNFNPVYYNVSKIKPKFAFIFEITGRYCFLDRKKIILSAGIKLSYIDKLILDYYSFNYTESLTSLFVNPNLIIEFYLNKRVSIMGEFGFYSHIYEFDNEHIHILTKELINQNLKFNPSISINLMLHF